MLSIYPSGREGVCSNVRSLRASLWSPLTLTAPVSLCAPDFQILICLTSRGERSAQAQRERHKSQMQRVMYFNNTRQTAATFQRLPLARYQLTSTHQKPQT